MGREVREIGVELAPEILNELSRRTCNIRHQSVTRLLHTRMAIIP